MGDFSGLDDLMTENPRVVQRDDRHLRDRGSTGSRSTASASIPRATSNPEFWQQFVPAMLTRAQGERHPELPHLRRSLRPRDRTRRTRAAHARRQAARVLDFAFRQAVVETVAGTRGDRCVRDAVRRRRALAKGGDTAAIPADLHRQSRRRPLRHVRAEGVARRRPTTRC